MRKYVYIGLGGFFGAVLRCLVKGIWLGYHGSLPLNTLIINISGCFLLGLVLTAAMKTAKLQTVLHFGVATGFIGAFTTFSTLCRETAELISRGNLSAAAVYIALSVVLGLGAAWAGVIAAKQISTALAKNKIGSNYPQTLADEEGGAD